MNNKVWYTAKTENAHDQGLVIEEGTGRNVAVTYDGTDAPMVAASHDLYDACAMAEYCLDFRNAEIVTDEDRRRAYRAILDAMQKARGE